ncbi:ROK family protein [Porphyromonadaceae bacterium W3.11]|nr:ROK family protein [Porphyromonadaceae bacterium W3.11]
MATGVNEIKPFVVGVDIGGTNTVFGIVDARGKILRSGSIKTGNHPIIEDFIDELAREILDLIDEEGGLEMIHGVGVGAPNANFYTGTIDYAANLMWKGRIPFAHLLSNALKGLPVALTNDANAAAIGEMTYGAARGMRDFIEITLGTGVGSGIVVGGKLVYGYDGFAGELGHTTVRRNGRICGCGRYGCLETYCSATGVARTAQEFLSAREDDSLLRKINPEEITSKDVFEAAMKGDKMAEEIFESTGEILGEALANAVHFSSPEAIILFGGLTKAGKLILEPTRKSLEANLLPTFQGRVKLLVSDLSESDAAVLGASALGWEATRDFLTKVTTDAE